MEDFEADTELRAKWTVRTVSFRDTRVTCLTAPARVAEAKSTGNPGLHCDLMLGDIEVVRDCHIVVAIVSPRCCVE